MEKKNSTFRIIKWFYFLLISSVIVYNIIYLVGPSFNESINSYNHRLSIIEDDVVRGNIYDYNGTILATTVVYDGYKKRYYPYHEIFAHVIGYAHQGNTGIEALANIYLLKSHGSLKQRILKELSFEEAKGDHIYTTLDAKLQQTAYEALGDHNGAVIAINPSTGQILAMVSKPTFDPNSIVENWTTLINDVEASPLLNRGTQGLYPPGSTYKIVTTAAYLQDHEMDEFSYFCRGYDYFGDRKITCYRDIAHGRLNLETGFAVSCNTAFATLGQEIDNSVLKETNESLLFNQPLPYPLPYSQSRYALSDEPTDSMLAETVIGQGHTVMTPLHNLLITCAIANGGLLMKPYLIDRIESDTGQLIEKFLPTTEGQLLSLNTSSLLTEMMGLVVSEGTGDKAYSEAYQVAGKTGSAELDNGITHAWFVGFAPIDHPEIAIVVLVEDGKSGGTTATPIAHDLFDAYLLAQ